MKMRTGILTLFLVAAGAPHAFGGTIYNNLVPANDTLTGVDFTANGAYAIGDRIGLVAPSTVTLAVVELFNNGNSGTFDATLGFYQAGSPVGTLIGETTLTGVAVDQFSVVDLYFALGHLDLPQDVVFLISPSNLSDGLDLCFELYANPPAAGTNTADSAIVLSATGAAQVSTGPGGGNPALQLSQTDAPEPASWLLLGPGLALAAWRRRYRTPVADRC
jgi:hypothetical protein